MSRNHCLRIPALTFCEYRPEFEYTRIVKMDYDYRSEKKGEQPPVRGTNDKIKW